MSDEERAPSESGQSAEAPEPPTEPQPEPQPGASAPPPDAETLRARIAELETQLAAERDAAADYLRRWQQGAADLANLKRRMQSEQEQRDRLGVARTLGAVLPALDTLERAFAALPPSLRGYTWIDGVALVELQLRRALDTLGAEVIGVEPGQPFDPKRHEAIGEVESDAQPAGSVAVVVQRGYTLGDFVLRPALVQLARAPQPAEAEATP